jgi:glycolate oxidase iron-sulfur subunit
MADAPYLDTLDCVHCGLCLPVCPTYRETGRETSSPRGRVYLMRGLAEGQIELGDVVAEEAFLCLGCRACETACPSGVRYGALLEQTRAQVQEARLRGGTTGRVERAVLRNLVPKPRRLRALFDLLALGQRLRLDRPVLAMLPPRLRALAPRVPPRGERRALPSLVPARGEKRGRVGLFTGCVMPELFGATNAATAEILAHNGFEVVVVRAQGCCGALQAHAGDAQFAHDLLQANVAAFGEEALDAVVVNSAGCGAFVRDSGTPLADLVRDPCEWLDAQGVRPFTQEVPLRVCYDDPCHLVHGQGVHDAPRRLLEAIPGLELVPHADPTSCCGAAGTYNLTQPEMSAAVLARKMDALAAADPDVIASGNPGCMMQLRAGVAERGLRAQVRHPVDLLAEAWRVNKGDEGIRGRSSKGIRGRS